MKNIFKIFSLSMVLGFINCSPETKVDKIEKEHSLEKDTIKNSYLTDTINNVFLSSNMKKIIFMYLEKQNIDKNVEQKLGYILIDKISDTTLLFIGTDFNHKMLYNPDNTILGILILNEISFPIYIKASKLLIKSDLKNRHLNKEYAYYGDMFKYNDLKAWKVKCFNDQFLIEENFTSVYHSKEVPFVPPSN